jgi:small subunit ribosomal protein S35
MLYSTAQSTQQSQPGDTDEFRTLDLVKKQIRTPRKKRERRELPPPRYKKMSTTQDWASVWPTAKTFHPASVPLPLHQGYVPSHRPVPNKFGNLELMKIPNFLHLTPPAIQRHCEALKQFCTPWPEGLQKEKEIDKEFPISIMTSDYCHSSPTIRDHRARIVTLRFKLATMNFDEHARDKFLRLVGNRYDIESDIVTIVTDCCPLRKQNLDYAMYLITALYHESWSVEPWEDEKLEEDMEKYVWSNSLSQKRLSNILNAISENESNSLEYIKSVSKDALTPEGIVAIEPVKKYEEAVTSLHNQGETLNAVSNYGNSVRELFKLPSA